MKKLSSNVKKRKLSHKSRVCVWNVGYLKNRKMKENSIYFNVVWDVFWSFTITVRIYGMVDEHSAINAQEVL